MFLLRRVLPAGQRRGAEGPAEALGEIAGAGLAEPVGDPGMREDRELPDLSGAPIAAGKIELPPLACAFIVL